MADRQIEIDRDYRRQVRRAYYMREEDFTDVREYNDYLEEVEDIIEQLINEETRAAARARLDKVAAGVKDTTAQNRSKLDSDRRAMTDAIQQERLETQQKAEQRDLAEQAAVEEQLRQRNALLAEVASGKQTTAQAQAQLRRHQAQHELENRAKDVGKKYKPVVQALLTSMSDAFTCVRAYCHCRL